MSHASDLLYALLALQMEFLTREQLVEGAGLWMKSPGRALPEILRERGLMPPERDAAVRAVVDLRMRDAGPESAMTMVQGSMDAELCEELMGLEPPPGLAETLAALVPRDVKPVTIVAPPSGDRYLLGEELGRGGLGRVVGASDTLLGRRVAVKIVLDRLRADLAERFVREARLTAGLEHPNIVPVYDFGSLKNAAGQERLFISMKCVPGRDLSRILRALAAGDAETRRTWTRTRLLMVFQDICLGVAYAHGRGVIHRDLKPSNVMIGDYGEVHVVDWGLAVAAGVGGAAPKPGTPSPLPGAVDESRITHEGDIVGTPAYMPPEQAAGQLDELDARSDIYSLGAILYEILTLRAPFEGKTPQEIISKVRNGRVERPSTKATWARAIEIAARVRQGPPDPPSLVAPPIPEDLDSICLYAMAFRKEDRYPNAMALHDDIQLFLEGARDRERAAKLLADHLAAGNAALARFRDLAPRVDRQAAAARALAARVQPFQPVAEKRLLWEAEARLEALEEERISSYSEATAAFGQALLVDPDCQAASEGRCELLYDRFVEAERRRDRKEMLFRRSQLEQGDASGKWRARLDAPGVLTVRAFAYECDCLRPVGHPGWRYEISADAGVPWRDGAPRPELAVEDADLPVPAVKFHPDGVRFGHHAGCPRREIKGAEVRIARYEEREKRLVPIDERVLGATPLAAVELPQGSYRCTIRAEGFAPALLPVRLERGTPWEQDVTLYRPAEIPPGCALVPGGPFLYGGEHAGGRPGERRTTRDLFVARIPVSTGDYLEFLNDLCAAGKVEEAQRRQPRDGDFRFCRFDGKRFQPSEPAADGAILTDAAFPVVGVSWQDALAFLEWRGKRDGRPWRLMHEEEFEKAARGVDGRVYPWGDAYDGTFSNTSVSHAEGQFIRSPGAFAADESPYGLLDMAGNTVTWCWNAPEAPYRAHRQLRGGGWYGNDAYARSAYRRAYETSYVYRHDGIRLCLAAMRE